MPADPAAPRSLIDLFDRIVVINLPHRADRRRGIDAELRKIGLSLDHPAVELFAAIRPDDAGGFPSIGARGAFRSHLGVMRQMLERGEDRILVLEDDMGFAPDAARRLPALMAALAARDWTLLYGHPGDLPERTPPADADGLIALPADLGLIQLHFLGLTRAAAEAAVPALTAMMTRPPGHPEGGAMHVDGALNWIRRTRPELTSLAIAPALAVQRPSRSDIAAGAWFDRIPGLRGLAGLARRLR